MDNNKSKQIPVWLSNDLVEGLQKLSTKYNRSMSWILRELLKSELTNNKNE